MPRRHEPSFVQHADAAQGPVRAADARRRENVRMRADDLRLQPPGTCPFVHRLRHRPPVPGVARPPGRLRAELHRHRGGDHPAGGPGGEAAARVFPVLHRRLPRGHAGLERPAGDPLSQGHAAYPRHRRPRPAADRPRLCLRGRRRGVLPDEEGEAQLRDPVPSESRGHRRGPMSQAGKKEDPLDFALWKRSKEGEPSWPSAWGPGRPGWHVECNAMAFKYLGAPLDIHGGGLDLLFPHHESEAVICEGAWGVDWSRSWMHDGFLTLEREKMSKSLGNFVTIREVLRDYRGEAVRLCLLKSHYRENVEYDEALLARAKGQWGGMRGAIASAKGAGGTGTDGKVAAVLARTPSAFGVGMDDDRNTHDAGRSLQRMTEGLAAFGGVSAEEGRAIVNVYRECGRVLGLFADLG